MRDRVGEGRVRRAVADGDAVGVRRPIAELPMATAPSLRAWLKLPSATAPVRRWPYCRHRSPPRPCRRPCSDRRSRRRRFRWRSGRRRLQLHWQSRSNRRRSETELPSSRPLIVAMSAAVLRRFPCLLRRILGLQRCDVRVVGIDLALQIGIGRGASRRASASMLFCKVVSAAARAEASESMFDCSAVSAEARAAASASMLFCNVVSAAARAEASASMLFCNVVSAA